MTWIHDASPSLRLPEAPMRRVTADGALEVIGMGMACDGELLGPQRADLRRDVRVYDRRFRDVASVGCPRGQPDRHFEKGRPLGEPDAA